MNSLKINQTPYDVSLKFFKVKVNYENKAFFFNLHGKTIYCLRVNQALFFLKLLKHNYNFFPSTFLREKYTVRLI